MFGEAGAAVAARAVDRRFIKSCRGRLQLRGEGDQLGDPGLRGVQLVGHQLVESSLHRSAPLTVPDADQVGDLIERTAELFGTGDEGETAEDLVVVEAVTRFRASGGSDEADVFVVAQRRSAEARALGDLTDREGAHTHTVKVQAGLKVKRRAAAASCR